MRSRLKYYLTIASISIATILGIIGIYQFIKTPYHLEASILSTTTPLAHGLKKDLSEITHLSIEDIKKIKGIPKINSQPDKFYEISKKLFDTIINDRINLVIEKDIKFFKYGNLIVATINNIGYETLSSVQMKLGYIPYGIEEVYKKEYAQIYWDDGRLEVQEFSNIVKIGDMPPQSTAVVYIYSRFPVFLPIKDYVVLSHRYGIGKINYFAPVPKMVSTGGGIFISFYWTSIISGSILIVIVITLIILFIIKRKNTKST